MKNRFMKHSSRILAMILAASMVISLGADITSATNVYAAESTEYTCGKEEHSHTDECYKEQEVETKELTCGQEEGEGATKGHEHSEDCYTTTTKTEQELICTDEAEDHTHTDDCYETKEVETKELTCGKEEGEGATKGHEHSEDCYTTTTKTEQVLDCDKEEHEHTDACKTANSDSTSNSKGTSLIDGFDDEGDISPASNDAYDFTNDITKATFTVDGDEIDANTEIGLNKTVSVRLDYTLPVNKVSADQPQIVYTLPTQLSKFEDSGNVRDASGTKIGTYKIENGVVTITFDSEFAAKNSGDAASAIVGYLTFSGKANKIGDGSGGQTTIKFNDKVEKTITIKEDKDKKGDISVEKKSSNVDVSKGTVDFTITVKSENGTTGDVTLKDTMTNLGLNGSLSDVSINPNPKSTSSTSDGFEITFAPMSAGSTYTITYTAKLPDSVANENSVKTKNYVHVESTNSDGGKIEDDSKVEPEFSNRRITKSYTDDGNGTITWTITVNQACQDISGATLSDVLTKDGQAVDLSGVKATISPAINGQTEVTFPITFPAGSNSKYTITYTTSYTKDTDQHVFSNTATVKKDDSSDPGSSSGPTGPTIGGSGRYLKTGTGVSVNEDGTLTLKWKVTIVPEADWESGWVFKDYAQPNTVEHYFTADQRTALKAALEQTFGKGNVGDATIPDSAFAISGTGDTQEKQAWTGVQFVINKAVTRDAVYEVGEFETTHTAPATTGEQTYANQVYSNNHAAWGQQTYTPPQPEAAIIKKVDENNENGGSETEHNYYDSKIDGKIKWKIEINIPETGLTADNYTVTETLPTGDFVGKLQKLSITSGSGNSADFSASDLRDGKESTATVWINAAADGEQWSSKGVDVTASMTNNVITVTLPKDLYSYNTYNRKIYLNVWLELNNTNWPSGEVKEFKNTVQISNSSGSSWEPVDQTQKITYNDDYDAVDKSSVTDDNVLQYSVVVNPHGKTYTYSDTNAPVEKLTLEDVLTYTHDPDNGAFDMTLVPKSVKIYYYNAETKKATTNQITEDWSYLYDESAVRTDTSTDTKPDYKENRTNKLTFTIPNGVAMVVTYEYKVSGTVGAKFTPSNTATLKADSKMISSDDWSKEFTEVQSGSVATVQGLTIYKEDEDNNGIYLPHAVFKLEIWNSNTEKWDAVKINNQDTAETDDSGKIQTGALTYNRAYKLTEISAPGGYEISKELKDGYQFYIYNTNTTSYPLTLPTDFTGKKLSDGQTIYLTNKYTGEYTLPETGGSGTLPYTLGGLTAILFSLLSGGYVYRRKYICNK